MVLGNASLAVAGLASSESPFWGCGLLGQLPGINKDGSTSSAGIAKMIEGLKKTTPLNKVSYWNWNFAPMTPADGDAEHLTEDFIFMPEQWGVETVNAEYVRDANAVGFLDSSGQWCPAQMADIFLGANEPDIQGSCMGNVMGACRYPCTDGEVQAGDCPVAHLLEPQGSGSPNSRGACDCWSDSHSTGCGFWPVKDVSEPQPLPTCWDNPECVSAQLTAWRGTSKILAAKGYKYATAPLVAVNMEYIRSFISHACDGCSELECGCPTHIGWHFYANDCLSGGAEKGYADFQRKLDETVKIMEEFPFIQGAIVNEVGMLNCAMDTPDAICIPNGPNQKYPALSQPDHGCPSTDILPNGLASFITDLLAMVSKSVTSDGRRAVRGFTWFNLDMAGGTYNLQLFNGDGSVNPAGEAYIEACQAWANGAPMPGPVPVPPTPAPLPPAPVPPSPTPLPSPVPATTCSVGDAVLCPGSTSIGCAGNQCCPDGSACPSAEASFTGCGSGKSEDCTVHQTVVV